MQSTAASPVAENVIAIWDVVLKAAFAANGQVLCKKRNAVDVRFRPRPAGLTG